MQPVTDTFLDALRAAHSFSIYAEAVAPDGTVVALDVIDGSVTVDRTADQRRALDMTVAPLDPDSGASVFPDTPSDPVGVYGTEINVHRGISFANGVVELVPLGVFQIETVQRQLPGGGIGITAWDRSRQVYRQRFLNPRKFAAQTALSLITTLITDVFPDAVIHDNSGGDAAGTTIKKHVVDRDRWAEVVRVAHVIGCEVFVDVNGEWVIQPVPDPTIASSVWEVDAGLAGVLVDVTDQVSNDAVPNIVVALGESLNGDDPPVHSVSPHGWNLDPTSPTVVDGSYGRVPRFYTSKHIRTTAQANKVADAQLADHLGMSRSVSFTSIVNPALDAGDTITVTYPDGSSASHIIDSLSIPLSPGNAMSAETRATDWTAAE